MHDAWLLWLLFALNIYCSVCFFVRILGVITAANELWWVLFAFAIICPLCSLSLTLLLNWLDYWLDYWFWLVVPGSPQPQQQ
jgi:hypothetical protein